jgi:hypothetical protein
MTDALPKMKDGRWPLKMKDAQDEPVVSLIKLNVNQSA